MGEDSYCIERRGDGLYIVVRLRGGHAGTRLERTAAHWPGIERTEQGVTWAEGQIIATFPEERLAQTAFEMKDAHGFAWVAQE